MKKRKKGYAVLLGITVFWTLMALWTLLPQPELRPDNLIGYPSHCTFTPWSTLICLFLAGMTCKIRKRKFTENT